MTHNQSLNSGVALLIMLAASVALHWCVAPWQVGLCGLVVTLAFGAFVICMGEER